jgi:hypothetical protein
MISAMTLGASGDDSGGACDDSQIVWRETLRARCFAGDHNRAEPGSSGRDGGASAQGRKPATDSRAADGVIVSTLTRPQRNAGLQIAANVF